MVDALIGIFLFRVIFNNGCELILPMENCISIDILNTILIIYLILKKSFIEFNGLFSLTFDVTGHWSLVNTFE